jgi:phage regulator Rha-like protein
MTTKIQKIHKGEITLNDVQDKIITIQNKNILLDSDVAWLYGVETKRVNEAVNNNPNKFPEGYIIPLDKDEWQILKSKISTSSEEHKSLRSKFSTLEKQGRGQHAKYIPNAFTEKGLYMLATILKSEKATDTTIAIVEAFAKMRELSNIVAQLVESPDDPQKQADVMQKSSQILSDMVTQELQTTGTETSFEINLFSAVKIKHTIKKEVK